MGNNKNLGTLTFNEGPYTAFELLHFLVVLLNVGSLVGYVFESFNL